MTRTEISHTPALEVAREIARKCLSALWRRVPESNRAKRICNPIRAVNTYSQPNKINSLRSAWGAWTARFAGGWSRFSHTLLVLALPLSATAQPYMGAGFGYGQTGESTAAKFNAQPYNRSEQDVQSVTAGMYVGYRRGSVGLEAGALRLPEYRGTFYTSDYPAYKGLPAGTYPQTASAVQAINASSVYARVNLYGPESWVTPYVFGGLSYTESRNRESAVYNGTDHAEHSDVTYMKRPIFGAGLMKGPMRVEYIRINRATDSQHTLRRDVQMVLVSAQVKF